MHPRRTETSFSASGLAARPVGPRADQDPEEPDAALAVVGNVLAVVHVQRSALVRLVVVPAAVVERVGLVGDVPRRAERLAGQ